MLEARSGLRNEDSARIEIFGSACVPPQFDDSVEELEANIERIGTLYNLDSVTLIQEPVKTVSEDNEIVEATILIPTMSLPEGSVINQLGDRAPEIHQTIDMFVVRDGSNHALMVYVYRGNNEALNIQAHTIVDSIQFMCSE